MDYTPYLIQAYDVAQESPDPSTQIGALILSWDGVLLGSGCNTFPEGLEVTPEMLQRPLKYTYIEHAERNAIFDAASLSSPGLAGATMVCPWASCAECARAIVQSGIVRLVRHADAQARSPERWVESLKIADHIMTSGGVEIIEISGKLGAKSIMHCEERWHP